MVISALSLLSNGPFCSILGAIFGGRPSSGVRGIQFMTGILRLAAQHFALGVTRVRFFFSGKRISCVICEGS